MNPKRVGEDLFLSRFALLKTGCRSESNPIPAIDNEYDEEIWGGSSLVVADILRRLDTSAQNSNL
jgi:hypothetical protein